MKQEENSTKAYHKCLKLVIEDILKAAREKRYFTYRRTKIRMTLYFLVRNTTNKKKVE